MQLHMQNRRFGGLLERNSICAIRMILKQIFQARKKIRVVLNQKRFENLNQTLGFFILCIIVELLEAGNSFSVNMNLFSN